MRFASAKVGGRPVCGLIEDDTLRPLKDVTELGLKTSIDLLRDPPLATHPGYAVSDLDLRPVVPNPSKIICLGLNYRSHVEETKRELPEYPVLFTKFSTSLIGPYEDIVKPTESSQVDFEGEMAIIIGRQARRVPPEDVMTVIAGFAVANDVTMRDFQYKTHQWLQGKAWERSTPLGPWLVTPDEVGDPGRLDITLTLNGKIMQQSNTERMIFSVPEIVAEVSTFTRLLPGDVILTGTPGGVGYRREPKVFLAEGDTVRVEVENVGRLENTVKNELTTRQ